MKPQLLLLFAIALTCGCESSRISSSERAALRPFAGSYYRGDGLGYNISLDLKPDGSYDAQWHGCLGLYGTARGSWAVSSDHILLSPSKERDMMKGHLRQLDIVQHGDQWILVQSDDRDFYDTHGASRYSCFQKREALQ